MRWPLGAAAVLVPSGAILIILVVTTWSMLGWPYPQWVQTSAQFHQQFTWAGLIAGAAACWYATVLHPKDRIWRQPNAPRAPGARHISVLTCWFVGAYLLGLLPLVASTVGGVGEPDPLVMVSGVLAMVAAVALGYGLGALVPSPVMVPLVAAGFYALLVVGSAGGERFAAVAPVLYLEPELGQRESVPLLVFRIALFTAVIVAGVGIATRPWPGILYLALPVALVAVSVVRQPVVFTADGEAAATCTERRDIRYCVHPDNAPRLGELVRAVDPVIARYGTKPANVDQVWDQALTYQPVEARRVEIAWLQPEGGVQNQVATTVAGIYACSTRAHRSEEDAERITQVAADLGDYLATGTPSGALAGMSAADVRQWVARHQDRLHACTLTIDQLP